jgi:hypothetical protein
MPVDWKDPKTGKVLARGTKLAGWPTGFELTNHRLDPVTNPYLDPDLTPDLAGPLFEDVYDLAAQECMDTRDKAMPPTMIGHLSRLILHPDHHHSDPTGKSGREAHHNHMHIQV